MTPFNSFGFVNDLIEPLSPREVDVLKYIEIGYKNRGIAHQLDLTVGTVKWYLTNIYQKLEVNSRTAVLVKQSEEKSKSEHLPPYEIPLTILTS